MPPEIDRGQLRTLLLNSPTPGTVRWGHSVEKTVPLPNACVRLEFTRGTAEEFDLVVGADGAWSGVRPALSDAQPAYSGVGLSHQCGDDTLPGAVNGPHPQPVADPAPVPVLLQQAQPMRPCRNFQAITSITSA
ncbi:FAD-dependent oxidoreductase [Streptomyces sp. NPDC101151]|uniref:FAD-dependent oxidoreductase n=1 Tax=Streptomyces sp. NPDC101151 TaxID=3366115 RepID=UPI00380404E1